MADEMRRVFRCPSCGMVRLADEAPFCRHGDPELVAARMEEKDDRWVEALGFSLDEIASWA
ncbi:MAG TPA: hypothetical protein VN609_11005 [Propionibacteriaceae bacterium]|nr:hypothetical protein [Propionibacteriaceae bacterium]